MKRLFLSFILLISLVLLFGCSNVDETKPKTDYVIGAYYISSSKSLPDPFLMTHIFYAFGYVNSDCNGIYVAKPERMKQIVELKQKNPKLKVLLSLGGEGRSEGFSKMSSDSLLRSQFVNACDKFCEENGLDGIDLDWEFPDESENDNYIELAKLMREKFGHNRLLTMASRKNSYACAVERSYIYFDFLNIMSYDMGNPPFYNAPLYSKDSAQLSVYTSVKRHLDYGIPSDRLVMGIPFYGRCKDGVGLPKFMPFKDLEKYKNVFQRKWDDDAKVPYLADSTGLMMVSYDDVESISYKSDFAVKQKLRGVMYWQFGQDDENQTLTRTVFDSYINSLTYSHP